MAARQVVVPAVSPIHVAIRGRGCADRIVVRQPQIELVHIQALADHNIKHYNLRGEGMDALDSDGADTVRRGGMRWA